MKAFYLQISGGHWVQVKFNIVHLHIPPPMQRYKSISQLAEFLEKLLDYLETVMCLYL